MIPWSFSAHSGAFPGKTIAEIISICKQAGLSGLEGFVPDFSGKTSSELEAIAAEYRGAGMGIETFHLPFLDPAAFYETERQKAVRDIRFWMERASLLGAGIGILHPTMNKYGVAVEGIDPFLTKLDKTLQELLPAADTLGMDLALENMPPAEGGWFGSYPEHFVLFREKFSHARLKFCLDTGHALMTMREQADEFFPAMGQKLAHFHIQDTPAYKDLHLAPGHGRVDWQKVFRGMAELKYQGAALIEAWPFAPDWTVDAWCEMTAATRALAEEALQDE